MKLTRISFFGLVVALFSVLQITSAASVGVPLYFAASHTIDYSAKNVVYQVPEGDIAFEAIVPGEGNEFNYAYAQISRGEEEDAKFTITVHNGESNWDISGIDEEPTIIGLSGKRVFYRTKNEAPAEDEEAQPYHWFMATQGANAENVTESINPTMEFVTMYLNQDGAMVRTNDTGALYQYSWISGGSPFSVSQNKFTAFSREHFIYSTQDRDGDDSESLQYKDVIHKLDYGESEPVSQDYSEIQKADDEASNRKELISAMTTGVTFTRTPSASSKSPLLKAAEGLVFITDDGECRLLRAIPVESGNAIFARCNTYDGEFVALLRFTGSEDDLRDVSEIERIIPISKDTVYSIEKGGEKVEVHDMVVHDGAVGVLYKNPETDEYSLIALSFEMKIPSGEPYDYPDVAELDDYLKVTSSAAKSFTPLVKNMNWETPVSTVYGGVPYSFSDTQLSSGFCVFGNKGRDGHRYVFTDISEEGSPVNRTGYDFCAVKGSQLVATYVHASVFKLDEGKTTTVYLASKNKFDEAFTVENGPWTIVGIGGDTATSTVFVGYRNETQGQATLPYDGVYAIHRRKKQLVVNKLFSGYKIHSLSVSNKRVYVKMEVQGVVGWYSVSTEKFADESPAEVKLADAVLITPHVATPMSNVDSNALAKSIAWQYVHHCEERKCYYALAGEEQTRTFLLDNYYYTQGKQLITGTLPEVLDGKTYLPNMLSMNVIKDAEPTPDDQSEEDPKNEFQYLVSLAIEKEGDFYVPKMIPISLKNFELPGMTSYKGVSPESSSDGLDTTYMTGGATNGDTQITKRIIATLKPVNAEDAPVLPKAPTTILTWGSIALIAATGVVVIALIIVIVWIIAHRKR